MLKTISRNIALVSAIFIVSFSMMLIVNYFQVRGSETIQSEVMEKLKQANEAYGDNPSLQEQIRTLDLLARKAYFTSLYRLKAGVVILVAMAVVFVLSLRIYFYKSKDIPDKETDPVDDWLIKSKTRKYIVSIAGTLALGAVLFAALTSPYLKNEKREKPPDTEIITPTDTTITSIDTLSAFSLPPSPSPDTAITATTPTSSTSPTPDTLQISKVTHNGFRGNHSLGISSAKQVPTSWDVASGKNILWKVKIPRKGFNSPVINGNNVFFSGADDAARELYCYELSSGKELWRTAVQHIPGSPGQLPQTTEDTGLAASSVATNGRQVCAIFATGDVICTDMAGKQLWAKNIGVPDNHYGYASSLLIFDNMVIIQYDNRNMPRVMALDLATGRQRWVTERPDKMAWSSPIVATVNNKPQLILMGMPSITSYDPHTGAQNWRVECMSGEPASSPAYANGVVYGASEYATLIAINATDGAILWKANDFLPEVSSPVATKDFVFVATDYGVVANYNAQTGEVIKYLELQDAFYSSPVMVEGKIYLTSIDGKVFIFSAKSDFGLIHSFETGEKTFATPAFTDKKIVFRTEEYLYCVETK